MDHFHLADREPVALAIEAAARCRTLDELDEAIRSYKGHELAAHEPFVPSQRTRHANPIMIVTEKPETAEDLEEGKPFSGRYGQLMRETLARSGVDQADFHICYAVHWTPADEESPTKTQISASRPFLFREIELVRPRAIMAMGRGVVEALTMYRGKLTEIVGQTLLFRRGDFRTQAYVTFHPAFPLRLPMQIPAFHDQVAGFFDRFGMPTDPALPRAA